MLSQVPKGEGPGAPGNCGPNRKKLLFPSFGRQCFRRFRFTSFGLYRRGNEHDEYNREDQEKREQDQQDFHVIRPFGDILTTRINNSSFALLAERNFSRNVPDTQITSFANSFSGHTLLTRPSLGPPSSSSTLFGRFAWLPGSTLPACTGYSQ